MIELSIVLPTCNRAEMLRRAIDEIEQTTRCTFEIIVVDGASTDRTADVLNYARSRLGDRLQVIRETQREGFVRGANKGFRAARGEFMTWLNDDARPMDGALDSAVLQMRSAESAAKNVGFVAMFHRWNATRNIAYETIHHGRRYRLCHVRGTLYANFPLGRRATFEQLEYFDERYFVCAADPDLSLKAWIAGLTIEPAYGAIIDHDECEDSRRLEDHPRAIADNEALYQKWSLPPRNPSRNDFNPARPCTLRRSDEMKCQIA